MNKLYLLVGVIGFDVLITLFAVGYLGAVELNPLCFDFTFFMIVKVLLTGLCLFGFHKLGEYNYVGWCVVLLIIFYSLVGINNLWVTVNYLYY